MPRPDHRHRHASVPGTLIVVILIALTTVATADSDLDGQAAPPDREPSARDIPLPGVTAAVLVDNGHGGYFPLVGYLSFLAEHGWQIAENVAPITLDLLSDTDILIVPHSTVMYSADETAAIEAFVAAGGSLWVFGEIYGPYEGSAAVAAAFGITYHWDTVRDPVQNEEHQGWPTIDTLAAHPVNTNVDEYGFYSGVCMDVAPPAVVISRASVHASSDICGPEPPVMAAYEGVGRALFCGDATMFWPQYFPNLLDSGEVHLLYNMAEWLAGGTPVITQARSWSDVKASFR